MNASEIESCKLFVYLLNSILPGWDPQINSLYRFSDSWKVNYPIPTEAHVVFWEVTKGLDVEQFEMSPGMTHTKCVETLCDCITDIVDATKHGDSFLESEEARDGCLARVRQLTQSVGGYLSNDLGYIDPAPIVSAYTGKWHKPVPASASTFYYNIPFAISQIPPPPSVGMSLVCECGAAAVGSPSHSNWCPLGSKQ